MKRAPQKSDPNRYLVTYADLMNLLLILFIVLFCSCSKDVVKVNSVMTAISQGFGSSQGSAAGAAGKGSGTGAGSGTGSGKGSGTAQAKDDYSDFYQDLIGLINKNGIKDKVDITDNNTEVIITLKDNVLFAPSKAELGDSATSLLKSIGGLLKNINYGQLIVEGHTDSDPIHTAQFQDNTELSLIRAYNVSKIFTDVGLSPKKVLPVGYGENYPVAPNNTAANKSKNRRVVITILKRGLTPADDTVSAGEISAKMEEIAKKQSSQAAAASSQAQAAKAVATKSASTTASQAKTSTSAAPSSSSKATTSASAGTTASAGTSSK